jgi:cytochrome c-type biogenesis protein
VADSDFVFAFWVGVLTFYSPCSVGLIPAYVGHFLTGSEEAIGPGRALARGLRLGAVASLGFLLFFSLLAAISPAIPLADLGPALPWIGVAVGLLMIAFGILLAFGRSISVPVPRFAQTASLKSVFLFGIAYAAASIACTFAVFLSVIARPISRGDASGLAQGFLGFAVGMAAMMVTVSGAASVSREGVRKFLSGAIPWVQRLSAALLILGGAYILYYWYNIFRLA